MARRRFTRYLAYSLVSFGVVVGAIAASPVASDVRNGDDASGRLAPHRTRVPEFHVREEAVMVLAGIALIGAGTAIRRAD